jgi:type IV secretory pathway VirB9-like protein
MATPAASGDPRNTIPHLAVKPQVPGIETNLTIYTTKHIYHLLLHSRARDAGGGVLLSRRAVCSDERC